MKFEFVGGYLVPYPSHWIALSPILNIAWLTWTIALKKKQKMIQTAVAGHIHTQEELLLFDLFSSVLQL